MSSRHSGRTRRARVARSPLDDLDLDLLSDTLFGPPGDSDAAAHPRPSGRAHARRDPARALGPLCREVERTLGYAFAAAGDPVLRDLTVVDVTPAPNAARLAVVVAPSCPLDEERARALLERLARARSGLRAELASVLQRKRTPDLQFALAGAWATEDPR